MYNVLPPSNPVEPFDRHGRLHFLAHGVAIGIAVSAAVPGLPQWLFSILGAQVIAWSALGLAVSLVALKLVFGTGWKTATSLLFILTGGLFLGTVAHHSGIHGAGVGAFLAAAMVLGGLTVIYHESRVAPAHSARETNKGPAVRLTDPQPPPLV